MQIIKRALVAEVKRKGREFKPEHFKQKIDFIRTKILSNYEIESCCLSMNDMWVGIILSFTRPNRTIPLTSIQEVRGIIVCYSSWWFMAYSSCQARKALALSSLIGRVSIHSSHASVSSGCASTNSTNVIFTVLLKLYKLLIAFCFCNSFHHRNILIF